MWSINEPRLDPLPYSIWKYKSCNKIEKQLFRSVTNRVLLNFSNLARPLGLENFVMITTGVPMAAMSARLEKNLYKSEIYPDLSLRWPVYWRLCFNIWLHAG